MIDRRALISAAAGAIGAGGLGNAAAGSRRNGRGNNPKHRPSRPDNGGSGGGTKDLVLIVLDDMRTSDWDALRKTRMRLAGGTWFPRYINSCPLCSPSRVSLMTGLFAHNHHVLDNGGNSNEGGHVEFRQQGLESRTLNFALQRAGYHTGLIGKFLNGFKARDWRPDGWDRWVASTGLDYTDFDLDIDGERIPYTGDAYKTDVLADEAVRFIEDAPADQPIFLHFSPTAPHGPSVPAPRHEQAFPGVAVTRDQAFNEVDVSDKPTPIQELALLTPEQIAALDQDEGDRLRTLLAADEAIVAVVDALERAKRLDDAHILIVSDNGYMLGQHRLNKMKGVPYDQSIRVPMLAWGKSFTLARSMRLVANVDIAPTLAALAGAELAEVDGVDMLGGIRRDYVLLEMPGNQQAPMGTGLRSAELMYVEYSSGEREFYDERSDPRELVNLLPPGSSFTVASPEGLPAIETLSVRTRALGRCAGIGCR